LGGQQNPWGFESIKGKFRNNARLALTETGVDAAVDAWSDIPRMTDIAGAVRKTLVKNGG
jgi:hypothetical protein